MTHLDLANLRRLLDASSLKLPLCTEGLHDYGDGDPPGIDFIRDATGERVVVADSGVYPPAKPDADLLVAAVNALPQLLAVYEAAQTYCDVHYKGIPHPRYPAYPCDELLHAVNAIRYASPPQERHE